MATASGLARPDDPRGAERLRWGFITLVLLFQGTAAIGAAFAFWAAWSCDGVTIDVVVNAGTALLLAGFLFGVQRNSARCVIDEAQAVVRAEVRAAERRLENPGSLGLINPFEPLRALCPPARTAV